MRLIIAMLALSVTMWTIVLCAAPYQTYKKDHCEWCGTTTTRLVVHHIVPQHVAADLANDHPENYLTVCDPFINRKSGCHWKIGHRGIGWDYDNSVMVKVIVMQLNSETNVWEITK